MYNLKFSKMKKLLFLFAGVMLLMQQGYSQQKTTWTENFDGVPLFTPIPSNTWGTNATYSKSFPYSCWGKVPVMLGDSIMIVSPIYDFATPGYQYAYLRFSHICKLSPSDTAYIQYRDNSSGTSLLTVPWQTIPGKYYAGKAVGYAQRGFSANSYPEWRGNDSTIIPSQDWWKEETFELTDLVGYFQAQFRFIIKRGRVSGSNIAYGWLIDDFELVGSTYDIRPPIVDFMPPLVKDTVYGAGPWEINAKVKSSTRAGLHPPYLVWTTSGGVKDSLPMTMVKGDSLWKATIPQYLVDTKVVYSITGTDSSGNTAFATSNYTIAPAPPGLTGFVTIGTGTSTTYYNPYYYNYNYSYSRNYYKSHEISPYRMGGLISSIAFYSTQASNVANITFYLKATADSVNTSTAYIDPLFDGAMQVWGEAAAIGNAAGWITFQLNSPFYLPPNMNLLVYCDNKNGNYPSQTAAYFQYTNQTTNTSIYAYGDASFPPTNSYMTTSRPNLRLYFVSGSSLDNSAAVHSIDMNDTIPTSSTAQAPVVVTVRNKGTLNLDSVTVSYSINGSWIKDTVLRFNSALPPDFNHQDTIGYYIQNMNRYDTLTVWVTYPNGATDSTTWDDTLTKRIYGTKDVRIEFFNPPADTVYNVGPFDIAASIHSWSGKTVVNTLSLYVESDIAGTTYYDSLPMTWNGAIGLWETIIPKKPFGSTVRYKLMITDFLGNIATNVDSFYVNLLTVLSTDTSGYAIVGDETNAYYTNPFYYNSQYGWTRQVYLSSEIRPSLNGGLIKHLAWDLAFGFPIIKNNQKCYFKAVDDTVCANGYIDPVADGATLVWQGNFLSSAGRIWAEIPLSTPFMLPPGKNLMIYWMDEAGAAMGNSPYWYCTTKQDYMAVYAYGNGSMPVNSYGSLTYNRPNARFYIERVGFTDSNSIALVSIDSPPKTIASGTVTPVTITVKNTGFKSLSSCNVYCRRNGATQSTSFPGSPTYTFPTPLLPGYTHTFNIASFTTTARDSIVVWVSLPNGQTDPVKTDDTLSNLSLDCPKGVLSGKYVIGTSSSADFTTIRSAISYLENCGFSGKVTLQLENRSFNESADFSRIRATANDTIELLPLSGNPVIQTTKFGIKLGNVDNIIIRNIRINITGEGYGIWITSGNNIEISGCTIVLDSTLAAAREQMGVSIANTHNALYKDGGISHNVRILNNTFVGGYNTVLAYGRDEYNRDTAWTFDGNTIKGAFYMSAYLYFIDFLSIARNTCIAMYDMRYITQTWVGFCVQDGIANVIEENKIYQRAPLYIPRAFILTSMNSNTTPIELRNNEVILAKTGNYVFTNGAPHAAFILQYTNANIYHNSAYISEDEISTYHLLYLYYPYSAVAVKNNNFVATDSRPLLVYDYYATVAMDYNNYYTGGTAIGTFRGTVAADLAAWKPLTNQDTNSISVLPNFINPSNSLKLSNLGKMGCPMIPGVIRDIEQSPRGNVLATMGCYESVPVVNLNATLLDLTGLREGSIGGQTDTLKVVVLNSGIVQMTFVNISWSLNGVTMHTKTYPAPLNSGQSMTIALDLPITYPYINSAVKVWINTVNSGLIDGFQGDDTLSRNILICPNGYSGLYTVGPSSYNNFKTIQGALDTLSLCGVNGDITFAMESGTYNYGLSFTNNFPTFGNYKLTVTSATGNANDVIIQPVSGPGITIGNATNLTIKAITIDARTSVYYGVYFTSGCTNLVIRDCKILCDTVTTSGVATIFKSNYSLVDGFSLINCFLDGGYYGVYFYGGSGTSAGGYGTNIVWDSNTFRNSYYYALYTYYCDFKSISHNKILSRTTNTASYWYGIRLYYCNAEKVVGNSVIQRNNTTISYPYGAYLYYTNQYNVSSSTPTQFANNEFILYTTSSYYGIYHYQSAGLKPIHYLHNSIYINGTGSAYGMYFSMPSGAFCVVKNNLIHTAGTSSYPIYLSTAFNSIYYDIDYNNMYAPTYVGYASGARTTISGAGSWQSIVTTDLHSVKVLPSFTNPANSLELLTSASNIDSLRCPWIIAADINGTSRPTTTTMGAYEKLPEGLDLMVLRIQPDVRGVIDSQHLSISVDIMNCGATPISKVVLRWSLNGTLNPTPITATFNPSLKSYEQRNLFLDSFIVQQNYDIVVWVDSINGQTDTVNWNDTASISYVVVPLAEFVPPFVRDTINQLAFNIYANIYEGTGAPVVTPPKMYLHIIMNGQNSYDSIVMVKSGSNWVAKIPPQYFNSKIIYSLYVSDTMGNNILLTDSVFIKQDVGSLDFGLTLTALLSPLNDPNSPCELSTSPVKILVTNTGGYDYDFTRENLTLGCDITAPDLTHTLSAITLNKGTLLIGKSDTFEIMPIVSLASGNTDIKAWINSARDGYHTDDTVTSTYISLKLGFPVEEDFNDPNLPPNFTSVGRNTTEQWDVMQGNDGNVVPQSGGMIRFGGTYGAVSQLYMKQIDIYGALQPTLTLWYFHDTVPCDDYTVVKVVLEKDNIDGGEALTVLYKQGSVYGWKQYDIGLAQYAQEPCVVIVFESMSHTQTQYIDKIYLHATQNLSLDTILIPRLALCDFDNKDIQVVISNPSAQSIDFSKDSTRINLRVNTQDFVYKLNNGTLASQTKDTITMTNMSFVTGTTYNLTATVMDPIDPQSSDDITRRTLALNPSVAIAAIKNTNSENCFPINTSATQTITLQNKGNFDIYELPLELQVHGRNGLLQAINDTLKSVLRAGASLPNWSFSKPYSVPMEEMYNILVKTELSCNTDPGVNIIMECVDFDIRLMEIVEPDAEYEEIGQSVYIVVRVDNKTPYKTAVLHAQILNGNNVLSSLTDTINMPIGMFEHTFNKTYSAPAVKNYTIKVFVDSQDDHRANDTVAKPCNTDVGMIYHDIKGLALGQNVPNPAKDNTLIEYRIPEDGQVIFTVYSITGQTLHTEKCDASSGKNNIEFNTINLTNGIYYYAMEYKGERLVKKMTIRK